MPFFDNQQNQYDYLAGTQEEQIIGAVITYGTLPVYNIPLTNGAFPFGIGNLVVSSNTPDGVLHDSEVFSSLRLRPSARTFGINSGDVQEVPTSGPTFFWKPFPYDRMVVPMKQHKDLKIKYADNSFKHPSLNSVYQVSVLIEYVEYCPDLEAIKDEAVREKIYRDFAESSLTIQEIDLDQYLDTK